MHKLIIEDDEGRTTVVPMVRDELTIGRKEGNVIRLTERNVSRRHARLFRQDTAICVEDFGSYTGVRVNGVRIVGKAPVRDGDQVQIGDYRLSIRSEALAEPLLATVPGLPAAIAEGATTTGTPVIAVAPVATGGESVAARAGVPAQAHLDASPTIPLRTLEEQGRAPKIPQTQAGRLVVVTTDLAGSEFRLDRASLVIGRTEENDIILNHASISRHHAKVVRDGDRYTVVDLQSANGVRVAGESYERVDVQPGDVVELGHVKLRFVGPWENWTFDPREFAPRSRRNLKIGMTAGGIALAAILILAFQGKKPVPSPPAEAVVIAPKPVAPSPTLLLAEATKAAQAEEWDKAVSTLDLLLGQESGEAILAIRPRAVELKGKVDLERRSADIFASFQSAVASKEPDVAFSRFDDIPSESVYKKRAEPSLEEDVKPLFLAAHLDLADSAREQGRCDEAGAEVEKIQQIDPENRKARDIAKKCRVRPQARVAATPTTPTPGPATTSRPTTPRPTAPRPARQVPISQPGSRTVAASATRAPSTVDPDEFQPDVVDLIKQAREAWMHQQCGLAIDLSRRALKTKPGSNDAHQIIAVCACSTKDKEGAIKSYANLDERSRAMVRTLCARNGVELAE